MKPLLRIGDVIRLQHQGLCEYLGTDAYMGQVTFKFRRLEYGDVTYILPERLSYETAADQPPAVSEDTALLDWADASGHHDCLYHSLREELRDQGKRLGDPMPDGPCPLCKGTGYYAPSVKADQPGCSCNDPNPRECCWNDDGEPCRCACHTTADNSPATSSPPTPAAL